MARASHWNHNVHCQPVILRAVSRSSGSPPMGDHAAGPPDVARPARGYQCVLA